MDGRETGAGDSVPPQASASGCSRGIRRAQDGAIPEAQAASWWPAIHSPSKLRQSNVWCGRRDLNPHGPCGPTDFLALYGFRRPRLIAARFGVWTIPSPCPELAPGVRCCPSSLYTFPAVSGRAWLGIAMLQGSPNLSSSASPVSRRALKFSLKSDASADSATPARFQVSTNDRLTRSDS